MKSALKSKWWTLATVAFLAGSCSAQLLVNPQGGTVLFSDVTAVDDNVATGRSLGFTTAFFTSPASSVDVSLNGNLNLAGDADYYNTAMPDLFAVPRISPLFTDLVLQAGTGASVTEKSFAGQWYAVTWSGLNVVGGGAASVTFQAVIVGANATLAGFPFRAGDIVFAYAGIGSTLVGTDVAGGVTVGLDRGDKATSVAAPQADLGVVSEENRLLLPVGGGSFLLFRADGHGSYRAYRLPVTVFDAARALRIACGVLASRGDEMPYLNVTEDTASPLVDLTDALRLLRLSAGLDP